ncbi:MAG: FAD-binding oxidoreductase [Psychromonas sp.]|nr:FAD-binding oxidoreductase [Psychromonas sp.]
MSESVQVDINSKQLQQTKVAIVGGGVAGATVALYLSELGIKVELLEKGPSLVNGPPICHLHAGGNLYREISDQQCLTLLAQSIDLLRLYPYAVDYRPTVIAVPKNDKGCPKLLLPRLKTLQAEYQRLIDEDVRNKVLGESCDYFRLFEREELELLALQEPLDMPQTLAQWMIPIAKNVDLEMLQFPLIMVQEYGLNLFRLAASAALALEKNPFCQVQTNSTVTNINALEDDAGWLIDYQQADSRKQLQCDYLINAAGFRSGVVDDLLGFKRQRIVEFKAAYVCKWNECHGRWPEVIFHGERGTPNGMAQLTPYPDGYFQLHGMTDNITLFKNGLVESSDSSAQPQLSPSFINKIDKSWHDLEISERTQSAIAHLTPYIPSFALAQVAAKPLFGAQQIPGGDPTLRAADVSFSGEHYARCEIVKASSVLTVADAITKQLINLGYAHKNAYGNRDFNISKSISAAAISRRAKLLAKERDYPASLAERNISESI